MQKRIANKSARYAFASLRELGEYLETARPVWSQDSAATGYKERSWDLNAGLDGAKRMARLGWIEGAQRAQEALKAFAPLSPAPDTRRDICGFRPHVPAFCAGAPDSMIRHTEAAQTGTGRVLTLLVNVTANAHTDAAHMANYGVAIAQYIHQLETQGVRVEVYGALAARGAGWRLACTWGVKRADQPLDLAVLAFTIGHPAMLRRLGLAFMERQNDTPEMSGYGTAQDVAASDLINAPRGVVAMNGMRDAYQYAATPKAALEHVTKQIDAAMAKQFEEL